MKLAKPIATTCAALIFLMFGALVTTSQLNELTVETVSLDGKALELKEEEDIRIVHLSDLHIGELGSREERLVEMVNELDADAIAITGDFVGHLFSMTRDEEAIRHCESLIARLDSRCGIWGVLGNTDATLSPENEALLTETLESAGVHLLNNSHETVRIKGADVCFIGLYPESIKPSPFVLVSTSKENIFQSARSTHNAYAHWRTEEALDWRDYTFSGRMLCTKRESGIGVTFYSQYPRGDDTFYRLRRYEGWPTFHIAPHGTQLTAGRLDSGVEPVPNVWYWFKVNIRTGEGATTVQAKVWRDETREPDHWQIDCYDSGSSRVKNGSVGIWSYSEGEKLYGDLQVRTLDDTSGENLLEDASERTQHSEAVEYWDDDMDFHLTHAMRGAPDTAYRILLSHYPGAAPWAQRKGVDLVLSGDTHGGQVVIPGVGPLYAKSEFQRKYNSGLFQLGSTNLVVSRGIGWNILPLRTFCPPEVITIVFESNEEVGT